MSTDLIFCSGLGPFFHSHSLFILGDDFRLFKQAWQLFEFESKLISNISNRSIGELNGSKFCCFFTRFDIFSSFKRVSRA